MNAAAVCMSLLVTGGAVAQSFQFVGVAPNLMSSRVIGVSADGTVAAGTSMRNNYPSVGFVWTQGQGRHDFGLDPGAPADTFATAISGDGTVIVGQGETASGAFRRVGSGLPESLGLLPGADVTIPKGVSGDGSTVVGYCNFGGTGQIPVAFRWTEAAGMQVLGNPHTEALGISRDGSTIVGAGSDALGYSEAYSWSNGMQHVLPDIAVNVNSLANAVSADGRFVVGISGPATVMWNNGQLVDLGLPQSGSRVTPYGVNDTGNTVVGFGYDTNHFDQAAIWTSQCGMEPLADYLAFNGVAVPDGWTLSRAYGVSGDGMTIVGQARLGYSTAFVGFVATVPAPATLAVGLIGCLTRPLRRR